MKQPASLSATDFSPDKVGDPMSSTPRQTTLRTTIVNPLGGTLLHYANALVETLRLTGADVEVVTLFEPSSTGVSRRSWLTGYIRSLISASKRLRHAGGGTLIVTWPVIGYFDFALLRLLSGRKVHTFVIVHDPEPLVHAVGYSRFARSLARFLFPRSGIIVHSDAALAVIRDQGLGAMSTVLPHPVRLSKTAPRGPSEERRAVRVLGQYKPDRDLELLDSIARASSDGIELEVWGRGWPSIAGWTVHDGFVTEDRLDELIATSTAVVIPYRRFYQSGIAIRALEMGTPFIGPRESSLADLYPSGSPLLVPGQASTGEAWVDAVNYAIEIPAEALAETAATAAHSSAERWRGWLERA